MQLAHHRAFLPVISSTRAFDVEKPLRVMAFAGYVPHLRDSWSGE